nr:transposase [Marinomonas primoryensis]
MKSKRYPKEFKREAVKQVTERGYSVAVGMVITDHPPHRSGRALLTHPAPTLGI